MSHPHGTPMKPEGGGTRYAVRSLIGIVVLFLFLSLVLGFALATASVDPFGMATAPPLTVSDVSKIEPLYGDVWTPNAAVSWSPDGRFVAVGGGFTAGVTILDALSGRSVRSWSVPGDIYVLRCRPTVIDLPWATSSESCRAPDGCTS